MDEQIFKNLLSSESSSFPHENFEFSFQRAISINLRDITFYNKFENCTFRGTYLNFIDTNLEKNYSHSIEFINCTFDFNFIIFKSVSIYKLIFKNCKINAEKLQIFDSKIDKLHILYSSNSNISNVFNCDLIIEKSNLEQELKLYSIKNDKYIKIDKISSVKKENSIIKLSNINIRKLLIFDSIIKIPVEIIGNTISETEISKNIFFSEKSIFSGNNFGNSIVLKSNEFKGITYFENERNLSNTTFNLNNCNFYKFVSFNNTELNHLEIQNCKFSDIASFQETKFNTINIDRTIFTVPAFFDDIKIINFQRCSKKTFRIIKQQLLLNKNMIDFNIFRSYELNAYRLELKKRNKKWYNDIDAFILEFGRLFSDNGLNWMKALITTIIFALFFYSIFYWITINHCNISLININKIGHFFDGFSKYLLVTDMHNPFENNKYVNGVAWLPFILGKIFLSIGIYEIIVSFRKYKNSSG